MINNLINIIVHIINNFISMLYHKVTNINILINIQKFAPRTELAILLMVDGILIPRQPLQLLPEAELVDPSIVGNRILISNESLANVAHDGESEHVILENSHWNSALFYWWGCTLGFDGVLLFYQVV